MSEVEELKSEIDRLEARIAQLEDEANHIVGHGERGVIGGRDTSGQVQTDDIR